MNTPSENIFPVFDKIISKEKKEKLLNQKGKVVWLTGLSGSGKTTNYRFYNWSDRLSI